MKKIDNQQDGKLLVQTASNFDRMPFIREVEERFSTIQNPFRAAAATPQAVEILEQLNADRDMIIVSVLRTHEAERPLDAERIGRVFGASVRSLYENSQHLDKIHGFTTSSRNSNKVEHLDRQVGRMIVAIVNDARVVVIHLVEQLCRMLNLSSAKPGDQLELADRTLSIYAPLANRLGIWHLKWQLEDLAFKLLNRPAFDQLATLIDERRVERERYIERVADELCRTLEESGIKASVHGRAKHIFGIWKKSQDKQVDFERIYDLRGVRVLLDDVATCYVALGVVHATWTHIADEFDDYIATPKENGYQSIHTAIRGPQDKVVEVQIRTHEMHKQCELGTQAHWRYKEGGQVDSNYQVDKVRWLRHILQWRDEMFRSAREEQQIEHGWLDQQIYVFTPVGNVVELPVGSTPIDFSYAIHTEVGHRCRGATVNGRIVTLSTPLQTGDWVEIRTVKSGGPSRDWMSSQNSFVATARARNAIGRWFRHEEHGRYQAQGRAMLDKELSRRGLSNTSLDKLATSNGFQRTADLYAAVGMKELKVAHALACLEERQNASFERLPGYLPAADSHVQSLSIYGVDNLLTSPASCCGPLPGDDVVGYVTVARGITIHKRSCGNVMRMASMNPERIVDVGWQSENAHAYSVNLEVTAEPSASLLPDITALASALGIELASVNTALKKSGGAGKILLNAQLGSADQFNTLLARLRSMPDVVAVRRIIS